jgi:hypothetical protein
MEQKVPVPRKSIRKSLPEYSSNPSSVVASQTARIGTKRIVNRAGDKCMIVSEGGEILAPAGLHEIVELDQTAFVKIFPGFIAAARDLSKAAKKVFDLVYHEVLANKDMDLITLHNKATSSIPRTTFERGVTELLDKEILYKSIYPAQYYINVMCMFNGNRLAHIKEYRLKGEYTQSLLPGVDA